MTDVAIRCSGIGKRYKIGSRRGYRTLRESLTSMVSRLGRSKVERSPASTFWALDGVSFEVKFGEILGVIGHNGAGKSTLLKVLSRITEPTRGEIELFGRVGSLLEVGTGFHAELTGRENIYLNGSILGMRREEIARKFDEIVAFSEVEQFIDTPVKRYSSGMYVRLAFAVAVHLEPEILIIDEVLAVGDAAFQKKCFRKMQEIGQGNRTILLVSHNMAAIRNICKRTLVLNRGHVVEIGETNEVVDRYLSANTLPVDQGETLETPTYVINDVRISIPDEDLLKTFAPAEIVVDITAKTDVSQPDVYVGLLNREGQIIAALVARDFVDVPALAAGEKARFVFGIDSLPLLPGDYQIELHVVDVIGHKFEFAPRNYPFEVVATPVYGGRAVDRWFGNVALSASVRVSKES
jgi:lipopolysaccharide transport system ATP-binding protein